MLTDKSIPVNPRTSVDRERADSRLASRIGKPTNIPLPTALSTSRPNSMFMHRKSESVSRTPVEDGRISQMSLSRALSPQMGQYSARPSFDAVGESPTAGGFSDAATDASSANGANVQGSTNGSVSDVDDGEKVLPVRVAVRIRPLIVDNTESGQTSSYGRNTSCLEPKPNASIVVYPVNSANGSLAGASYGSDGMAGLGGFVRHSGAPSHAVSNQPRTYNFDFVYGPETSQVSVFDSSIAPLLARFVEGYNVTILAYGQTSSGKTFTMGTDADATAPEDVGIVPRALTQIFQWTNSHQTVDETGKPNIDVRVSFMEVYNEELIDLVAQSQFHGVRPPIFIREDTKGNVVWVGVKEQAVSDAQHALSILIDGSKERQTGGTRMNDKSSRSHAIYTVTLTQQRTRGDSHEPVKIVSKLHFVDLAGSERLKKTQAEGERQREGISINSGLLALGNVISALGSPQRGADLHVPYRNSKLTYMLRDSLGGSAQTLLIACVSAAEANMAETVNTLKYAARARNIKNRGGVNMVSLGKASAKELEALRALVKKLKGEVHSLNQRLQDAESTGRDSFSLNSSMQSMPVSGLIKSPSSPANRAITGFSDSLAGESPSRIPITSAALQRRMNAHEELNVVKARNQTLETELMELTETYADLLWKFNEACSEIEERQSESFERDQRLRDREQEIRRLTSHSQHGRRSVPSAVLDLDESRPQSVADTLRQKRRSARLSLSNRSIAENERLDRFTEGISLLADETVPPMPDLDQLHTLQSAQSSRQHSEVFHEAGTGEGKGKGDGPGEAEFDAVLEEYDENIRRIEGELKAANEMIENLRLQLSMQETKATYAEKLNVSQQAQVETLRIQLTKAREAGQEEEQRRRAVEAELEDANFSAETQLESVANEWRLEMQHCDEQWTERWEAMQAEHDQALAESERQVAKLRTELEVEKAVPRLSDMPESDAELKQKNVELKEENAELRRELEALKVSQQETRELAASQQESQELIASQQELKDEVEELRRQVRAADARAQIAEEASAALAAKLAAQRDVTSPRMKDRSLSRQLSDKIVLRTRGSPSPRSSSSESDAQQFPGVPEEDDMTPPERRLWNMRNRHSATTPALPLSPAQPSSSDDKWASYPELRLASTARDSAIANAGVHRQAVYDEIQIQQMLKDAAAESDRQAGADKELRELRAKIEELREAKKELQQHNSQMKNIMRDLGDRLVKLAEENDMLEAKANERDSLIEEMRHMTSLVSEYEAKIHDLNVEAEVLRAARDKAEQACEAGRNDSKLGHRLSVDSFRSAAEETPTASDTPKTQHSADSDNDEAAALRVRLDLAEAELKVALRSTDEYRNRVDILLGDVESYKQHIGSLETALASTDGQLDTTRREASELRDLAARAQELEAELGSQKTLVVCLKESLASSEEQTEEIKLNADRYANELLRAQAEAKSLGDQVELVSQQLMDARQLVANEARDRDIWKSRCQDLREEVDEMRSRRRKSKMSCF